MHLPIRGSLPPFAAAFGLLVFGASGCQQQASPPPAGTSGSARIAIAPLQLAEVAKACYDLKIDNQDGDPVWQQGTPGQTAATKSPTDTGAICSDTYGNLGGGDITYVGTCDASLVDDDLDGALDDPNTNTVTVWVDGLYGANGNDLGGWTDPCPTGCQLSLDCVENADVLVEVNLTIMRNAQQGFFDVAVNFEDIFCSAKLDCVDKMLHNGDDRDTTVILGFACTAGLGAAQTTLYLNDVVIECAGNPSAVPPIPPRTYTVNTGASTPGNHGGLPPGIFQWASYFGSEEFTEVDKCYWNTAIGIDLDLLEPGCSLHVRGTAAGTPFTTPPFHSTPPNTVYPVVSWDVPLTDGSGALICNKHPLNGGNGVVTSYTTFDGERFLNSYTCGGTPSTSRLTCAGGVPGLGDVVIGQTADDFTISANGHTIYYPPLPSNLAVDGCCPDACCVEVP